MSKIKRNSIQIDPCARSIQILRDKCESFFNNHLKDESKYRVYVDDPYEKKLGLDTEEVVDFVLFGNAFKKFFESGNWLGKKIRIWVLSQSNKMILDSFLKDGQEVNVIPRYLLFPKAESPRDFKVGQEVDFVYAGRLSAQKNIESLLFFIKNYNEKFKVNSRLNLFGSFENTYHEDLGRRTEESYTEKISKLVDSLGLCENVTFKGLVDGSEWVNQSGDNSVFISLSTFISEDYGCAVAEAQQSGWPCIISDFGGHRDVCGSNVTKVPTSYIASSHCPLEVQSLSIQKLVSRLTEFSNDNSSSKAEISDNIVSLSQIDDSRRELLKSIGSSISLIHSDYIGAFSDTVEGAVFFRKIKSSLSSAKSEVSIVLFDSDQELSRIEVDSVREIFSEIDLNNHKVQLISSKNLFFKDVVKVLFESDKVFVIKDGVNINMLKDYFFNKLQFDETKVFFK